jgi:hypothetical protein
MGCGLHFPVKEETWQSLHPNILLPHKVSQVLLADSNKHISPTLNIPSELQVCHPYYDMKIRHKEPVVLVIGSEAHGLSSQVGVGVVPIYAF